MKRPRWWIGSKIALAVMICAVVCGCHRSDSLPQATEANEPAMPPWFADVTETSGLNFIHDAGPEPAAGPNANYFMPQAIGSGVALFDFNQDGLLDIYLLQNGGSKGATNKLYQQLPGGKFKDVSAGSGLDIAGYNMGVAIGDVNNDGWPDVLVTQYGGLRLLLNNGNGTFTDVTEEAGLKNPAWGVSAAFFDFDRDGWLDLVVVNYVDYDPTWPCPSPDGGREYCSPSVFPHRVSRLFRNLGSGPSLSGSTRPAVPRFQDVTVASGLGSRPGPGLGVVCADFNGDGWPDIFVANDGAPNHLWINRHNGTFAEEAVERGLAYNVWARSQAGMGVAFGDIGGHGLFDLYVTHLAEEYNTLWRQGPRGLFRDQTAAHGLANPRWRGTGFGTALADFDQDGTLDLAVVNGRIARGEQGNPVLGEHWGRYAERNQLFANDGTGHFRDVSLWNEDFCGSGNVARGLAYGDLQGTGALDLLVTAIAGRARLYKNVAPNRGHWLRVRAVEPALKRDAYGAEIRVRAGERSWLRWINPASSFLSSSDPRAHFGLGSAGQVDAIEVVWPDGAGEAFPGSFADREVVLRKGEGCPKGTKR
jgi:hypothetical protein